MRPRRPPSGLKGRHNLAQGRAQGQGPAAPPWVVIPMNVIGALKGRDNPDERCVAPLQGALCGWPATQGAAPGFALHSALGYFILPFQGS